MKNAPRTTVYWFNSEGPSTIRLDGRKVHYRDALGEEHTNSFPTSAAALSRYEGDTRIMHGHDSYRFEEA